MNLLYKTLEIDWLGNVMPMETINKPDQVAIHVEQYLSQVEINELGRDVNSYFSVLILDAKYETLNIDVVVSTHCAHFSPSQQEDLQALLYKY